MDRQTTTSSSTAVSRLGPLERARNPRHMGPCHSTESCRESGLRIHKLVARWIYDASGHFILGFGISVLVLNLKKTTDEADRLGQEVRSARDVTEQKAVADANGQHEND